MEYLVYQLLNAAERGESNLTLAQLLELRDDEQALTQIIRKFMAPRYQEGYEKGIHDQDALKLLSALLDMHQAAGLLRFSPRTRALGMLFWLARREDFQALTDKAWPERAQSVQTFGLTDTLHVLREELTTEIGDNVKVTGLPFSSHEAALSAKYLCLELAKPKLEFESSQNARDLADRLMEQLRHIKHQDTKAIRGVESR